MTVLSKSERINSDAATQIKHSNATNLDYRRLLDYAEQVYFSALIPTLTLTDLAAPGQRQFLRTKSSIDNEPVTFLDLVATNDRPQVTEYISRITNSGRPEDIEFRVNNGEKHSAWVRCRAIPRFDEHGHIMAIDGFLNEISKSKSLEENFYQATAKLHDTQRLLVEKDSAFKELLDQVRSDRSETNRLLQENIDRTVIPLITSLTSNLSGVEKRQGAMILKALQDVTSSFSGELYRQYSSLSRREVEICDLLKNGFSTKEISELLSISIHTIYVLRKRIRSKLGLTNEQVNLISHLRSL